jgi:hypothetical protein
MSFLAAISPEAASRLVVVIAVGALTTAGAGAGAATLLTGSPSPSAWLQAYRHTSECRQPDAAQNPRCSSAAAQAIFERSLAAGLELKAKQLSARLDSPAPAQPTRQAPRAPASSPAVPRAQTPSDDSGGLDD